MTKKELNLRIFEGTANGVLWQPVLGEWLKQNRCRGTLPEDLAGGGLLEIYDKLDCSKRYCAGGIQCHRDPAAVEMLEKSLDEKHVARIIRIPEGELVTVCEVIRKDGKIINERIAEYPVANLEQLKILTALIRRETFRSKVDDFNRAAAELGDRAEPSIAIAACGFTDMIKWYAGLENTYYLLSDYPAEVEEYLQASEEREDRLLETVLKLPCRIFGLGDHANNEFTPPAILKKYMLPRWRKISALMKKHKRFVYSHWDGTARSMLPFLSQTGLSGVEALTPKPMGDVTLEEIRDAVAEDQVVLDLLPAIFFLPSYPLKNLLDFAERVMDMFAPRLILGISDELPADGQIEKVRAISELVAKRF